MPKGINHSDISYGFSFCVTEYVTVATAKKKWFYLFYVKYFIY